jgi:hypothetical protein
MGVGYPDQQAGWPFFACPVFLSSFSAIWLLRLNVFYYKA